MHFSCSLVNVDLIGNQKELLSGSDIVGYVRGGTWSRYAQWSCPHVEVISDLASCSKGFILIFGHGFIKT